MAEIPLCSSCGTFPASVFCTCESPDVLICASCLPLHFMHDSDQPHLSYPITAYKYKGVTDYFHKLQARVERVPLVYEVMSRNMESIDLCVVTLKRCVEEVIAELRGNLNEQVGKLMEVRKQFQRDLDEAMAEVERSMYEEHPRLVTKYAPLIRHCEPQSSQLQVFHYQIQTTKPAVTWVNTSDQLLTNYYGTVLPRIVDSELRIHNVQTNEEMHVSVILPDGAMVTFKDSDSLLCIGGKPGLTTAQVISLPSGDIIDLAEMSTGRYEAGVVYWEGRVYVFGGNEPAISTCECLSLTTQTWAPLPPMHSPKHAFHPCRYEHSIYLPCANTPLEVFSLITESFEVLTPFLSPVLSPSFSFILEKELHVIGNGKLAKWSLGSREGFAEVTLEVDVNSTGTFVSPLQVGNLVYWVRTVDSAVVRFTPSTLSLELG